MSCISHTEREKMLLRWCGPLEQCFSIPVLGTPCSAHLACLPYLTHLIELISLLGERETWTELTSWWSQSGVLNKRDMQNVQSRGSPGLELRNTALENPIQKQQISIFSLKQMSRRWRMWSQWKGFSVIVVFNKCVCVCLYICIRTIFLEWKEYCSFFLKILSCQHGNVDLTCNEKFFFTNIPTKECLFVVCLLFPYSNTNKTLKSHVKLPECHCIRQQHIKQMLLVLFSIQTAFYCILIILHYAF